MKTTYYRKKKKASVPKTTGQMKTVRIDAKTSIQVHEDISDEDARNRYLMRLNTRIRSLKHEYVPSRKEMKDFKAKGLV